MEYLRIGLCSKRNWEWSCSGNVMPLKNISSCCECETFHTRSKSRKHVRVWRERERYGKSSYIQKEMENRK